MNKVNINPLLYLVPEEALLEGCLLADDAGPDGRISGIENPRIHRRHVAGGHKHAQETVQPHRHIAVGRVGLQLGQFVVFCQPSSFCIKSCGSLCVISWVKEPGFSQKVGILIPGHAMPHTVAIDFCLIFHF
jgi:hypothetical protein